jgi:Polyketide cyclase / dehydrase and lipid transport
MEILATTIATKFRTSGAVMSVPVAVLALMIAAAPALGQAGNPPPTTPYLEGTSVMSMKDDLANRSRDIHWPAGFTPDDADLFSHNELLINAPCERVWKHIVEATKWPHWYPNSSSVEILGGGSSVLKDNAVFRWTTFGLPLESRINEFVPFSRIGWFGYAPGTAPSFYHTWYLRPEGRGCRVVTDEVGKGESAVHFREVDEGAMHRGHDLWLAALKWVSESK